MRPEGVAAASRELKRALRARDRFVVTKDREESEDAWDAFLTHAGRVYEKLKAACYGHPRDSSWWRKKLDERRDDELLVYIHKARNSETHRLEEATKWIGAGQHRFYLHNYGTILETCRFDHLSPLPVRDRAGAIYDPPCRHRSRFIGYMDCGTIMWLAGTYLQELVKEANSRLR